MQFTGELIGSRLIETLTWGLYDGNLNCLREYIQNSIDSKADRIEIYFENKNNLVIKDNGSGMDEKELTKALGIGISEKSDDAVGWRGIGIWSGVPACKKIVIITKKRSDKEFRVEIDNTVIRTKSMSNISFIDLLGEATGDIIEEPLGSTESYENDHFTMIRLESISRTQKFLFSEKSIKDYLQHIVPVPFSEKSFLHADEINLWLESEGVTLPDITILFENEKIFRYPDRSDIFFNEIIKKEFHVQGKLIAVGWFLTGIENKVLSKPNVGIYFKKKGFTIGDEKLIEVLAPGENYSPWQYGEIHVISKEIRENAPRNNFEYDSIYIEEFIEQISALVKELQVQNRFQSAKIQSDEIIRSSKLISEGKLDLAAGTLEKAKEKILKNRKIPRDPSLQNMAEFLTNLSQQNVNDINELDEIIKVLSIEGNIGKLVEYQTKLDELSNPQVLLAKFIIDKGKPTYAGAPTTAKKLDDIEKPIKVAKNLAEGIRPEEGSRDKPVDIATKSLGTITEPDSTSETKKESLLDTVIRNSCSAMKKSIARSSKKGLEHLEMSATDPIKELLIAVSHKLIYYKY
ncbi:MAG: ATP-binding protein [Methanothrix sp.]|nr:ATP-binding protein [Methanothrix sp.]